MVPCTAPEETDILLGIQILIQQRLHMTLAGILADERFRQIHRACETQMLWNTLINPIHAVHAERVQHRLLHRRFGIRDIGVGDSLVLHDKRTSSFLNLSGRCPSCGKPHYCRSISASFSQIPA